MTVKVVAISTEDEAQERFFEAKQQGYVTFVYEHADPLRILTHNKFLYVVGDDELKEKIELLHADPQVVEELRRL